MASLGWQSLRSPRNHLWEERGYGSRRLPVAGENERASERQQRAAYSG